MNGSPRKNGDTDSLVNELLRHIEGEYKIVRAYTADISPCVDCRKCRQQKDCVIDDEMQYIYRYLEECDNVVIASPIYFSELTGKLLDLGSRLQKFFSAVKFRNETPLLKAKKGVVILTGGGSGDPGKAYKTAVYLLHYMNAWEIYPLICSHDTDNIPAADDTATISEIKKAADFLMENKSDIKGV